MKLGITMLNHNKDDIQFVTEFPCFLGHPVYVIRKSEFVAKTQFLCNNNKQFGDYKLNN